MKLRLLRGLLLFCPIMAAGGNENDVQAFEPDSVKLAAPTATHVLELLKGREAGVEVISSPGHPGMVPTIHIRGLGLETQARPVYVLNGMRVRNLDGLDPGLIDKIEVLKSASAMGIWGADAARGVVLVETKQAHKTGFHVDYSGLGGIHFLSENPVQNTFEEWCKWRPSTTGWEDPGYESPEASLFHIHNLNLQYGSKKFSAYVGGAFLDNDGPYKGREDSHRSYSGVFSSTYKPVSWFFIKIDGHWKESHINRAPDRWLQTYLVNKPAYTYSDGTTYEISDVSDYDKEEGAIQSIAEVRPLSGLYVRGVVGHSKLDASGLSFITERYFQDGSNTHEYKRGSTEKEKREWWQYGAEAGYKVNIYGHSVRTDLVFRKIIDDSNARRFSFNDGLSFQLTEMSVPKWKEVSIAFGYNFKERYKVDVSCYQAWENKDDFKKGGIRSPSVSLGWNLLNEPYLDLSSSWKKLEIEASWSETKKYYSLFSDFHDWSGRFDDLLATAAYRTHPPKTNHFDITASASFNAGGVVANLSVSCFSHKDVLMLSYTNYSPYSGYKKGEEPWYSMQNKGLELTAGIKGSSGDFSYSLDGHLTFYNNKMTCSEKIVGPIEWMDGSNLYIVDGMPLGCGPAYHYYCDGEDILLDYETNKFSGSLFPALTGGIGASLAWKRLKATVSGHGFYGNTIRHSTREDVLYRVYMENAGTEQNSSLKHLPASYINSRGFLYSDRSLWDGSFFRIDQIRLDYSLPIKGKVSAALYASLENWFLFTDYPGTDPEMSLSWGSLGIETARFPTTKRLIFGINVGF